MAGWLYGYNKDVYRTKCKGKTISRLTHSPYTIKITSTTDNKCVHSVLGQHTTYNSNDGECHHGGDLSPKPFRPLAVWLLGEWNQKLLDLLWSLQTPSVQLTLLCWDKCNGQFLEVLCVCACGWGCIGCPLIGHTSDSAHANGGRDGCEGGS